MKNLLNPKWIFFVNTFPLVVMFILFFGQFNIIKNLLDENNIKIWTYFALALGGVGLMTFAYAVYLTLKKKNVSLWFGFIALPCYIAFIYLYGYHFEKIIPFSIPQWMVSGNISLYLGTFIMPTLAYSLFVLVFCFTSKQKEYRAWVNFLIAIGIPIVVYLFGVIILPLWKRFVDKFPLHAFLILIITITLVFLFFLMRAVFILATKKANVWQKYQLAWKIPIAIVMPLLGLLINNGYWIDRLTYRGSGIFGDFHNIWFYILAVVNGIFICMPSSGNKIYRLLLFTGRSISFSYTLYFFLVFLPFLPLSIIAIIAVGVGFLMMTPLLLFIIHISELADDFDYLRTLFSKKLIVGISILSFLIIPAIITVTYLTDRSTLHEALDYLYSPDYSKEYSINKKSLEKTLITIQQHKDSRNNEDIIFKRSIPYLSSYFNWLVLDNLTLSDSKITTIVKIFFGNSQLEASSNTELIGDSYVEITKVSTSSSYDKAQNVWKSYVDLEITNKNEYGQFAEYTTTFDLPVGCWISDYYLYVGDKKEYGILSEKKSAMWVFSQILNLNRDPGILYYLTGNKVAFRVFPFKKSEMRKTGIEFLHKEPVVLNIDNQIIKLGNTDETIYENFEDENIAYISSLQKKHLNLTKRTPYFHFLIDVSKDKKANLSDFSRRIEQLTTSNKQLAENAKISFVNSYVNTTTFKDNWKMQYKNQSFDGGFYLDRAIRTALYRSYRDNSKTYPVLVAVTDSFENAILENDFADFKFAFPESNKFFYLDKNGNLKEHSLIGNPKNKLTDTISGDILCQAVLEYKLPDNTIAYLPNNNQPSIVLKKELFDIDEKEIGEKNWQSALKMQAKWTSQILHPEISNKEWLDMVKYSFISKVMTPVTSYLVVENEAQKAMLKKKQKQVLSGNKHLSLDEETRRMSEPSLTILTILLILALWCIKKLRI